MTEKCKWLRERTMADIRRTAFDRDPNHVYSMRILGVDIDLSNLEETKAALFWVANTTDDLIQSIIRQIDEMKAQGGNLSDLKLPVFLSECINEAKA